MVKQYLRCLVVVSLLLALSAGHAAWAQKRGGILRIANTANPPNMSILESATIVRAVRIGRASAEGALARSSI